MRARARARARPAAVVPSAVAIPLGVVAAAPARATTAGTLSDTLSYSRLGTLMARTGATAIPYHYRGSRGVYTETSASSAEVWQLFRRPASQWVVMTAGDLLATSRGLDGFWNPLDIVDWLVGKGCDLMNQITNAVGQRNMNIGCQCVQLMDLLPLPPGPLELAADIADCLCNISSACSDVGLENGVSDIASAFDCMTMADPIGLDPVELFTDLVTWSVQQVDQGWPVRCCFSPITDPIVDFFGRGYDFYTHVPLDRWLRPF